jgi:hypothetical protein
MGPKFPEEGQTSGGGPLRLFWPSSQSDHSAQAPPKGRFYTAIFVYFAASAATIVKSNPYARAYGLRNNQEICLVIKGVTAIAKAARSQ